MISETECNKDYLSRFHKQDPFRKFLKPLNHSCPICLLSSRTGRSKRFTSLTSLKKHVEHVHRDFNDYQSGLSFDNTIELITEAEAVLFWRVVY